MIDSKTLMFDKILEELFNFLEDQVMSNNITDI